MSEKMSKTIAEQLNVTEFPFVIKDKAGLPIYCEHSDNTWWRSEYDSNGNEKFLLTSEGYSARWEYDSNGNQVYYENSKGEIIGNRPWNDF